MAQAITGLSGWRREPDSDKKAAQPSFGSLLRPKLVGYVPPGAASDLRKFAPQRHDQRTSQSCVAQSTVRATEIKRIMKVYSDAIAAGKTEDEAIAAALAAHVALSRLALYFLSREFMDPPETDKDEGTIISLAAEAMRTFGVAREERDPGNAGDRAFWPFDLNKVFVSPSWLSMREASLHKISSWYRITSTGNNRVDDVIAALAAGNPVVFGTTVGDNWMQYGGGVIGPVNGIVRGSHATVLEGWDPVEGIFWDENSWGTSWGIDGFAKLSPDVISDIGSEDFIVIQGGWEPWHAQAA